MSGTTENKTQEIPGAPALRIIASTPNIPGDQYQPTIHASQDNQKPAAESKAQANNRALMMLRSRSLNTDMSIQSTICTPKNGKHQHPTAWEHVATPIPSLYLYRDKSLSHDQRMSTENRKSTDSDYFSSDKGFDIVIPRTPFGKAIRAGIINPLNSSASILHRTPTSSSTPNPDLNLPDLNLTPKARNSLLSILPQQLHSTFSDSGLDTASTATLKDLRNDLTFTPATAGTPTTNPTTQLIHKVFHTLLLSLSSNPTGPQPQRGLRLRLPPQKPILQALLTARTTLVNHLESTVSSPSISTGNTLDPQYHHEALTKREQKLREKDMQVYLREEEFGHYCAEKDKQIRKRIQEIDQREKILKEREKVMERREMAMMLREEWIIGWNEMQMEKSKRKHDNKGNEAAAVVAVDPQGDREKLKKYLAKNGGSILVLALLLTLYIVGLYYLVLIPLLSDLMDGLSWVIGNVDISAVREVGRMLPGIDM